jgi:hypothetical protein
VTKTAIEIQDNVYLIPVDNRDDLIKRIVAVCEQIPPEFLLNAAMGVSGRCRMLIFGNSIFFIKNKFLNFFLMFVYSEDKHLSE